MQRRQFLKRSAYLSVGTALVPQLLASCSSTPRAFRGKRVVLIHLEGGNDGLNTFVPFRDDRYFSNRPTLALKPADLIDLNGEQAVPAWARGLADLYTEGYLGVFNNVGYPEPNTSHFKSADIWHSAFTPAEVNSPKTGWVGRFLDRYPDDSLPKASLALETSNTFSLLLKGETTAGGNLEALEHFRWFEEHLEGTNLHAPVEHPLASYLQKTMAEAVLTAETLSEYARPGNGPYPASQLGKDLQQVAGLIKAGAPTLFFFLRQGGYDTHMGQPGRHEKLLAELGYALKAFARDLHREGLFKDTLVLVYSEFGRRVKENRNQGTDHGVGNNVMILTGNPRRAGILNDPPDLETLQYRRDVGVKLDFREIYATILER
ncbi:MAG: DUF1501 domain-containing protein, partial [Bacteroidetes bacterium]